MPVLGTEVRRVSMRMMRFVVATCLTFWIAYGVHAQQAAQPPNGAGAQAAAVRPDREAVEHRAS